MQALLDRNRQFVVLATAGERVRATRSLTGNFLWSTGGNACFAASQWAMVAVLSKLAAPSALGWFSLAMAITTPVFLFTNLNLRAVLATDAAGEFQFSDYAGVRLITIGLALLAVAALLVWGPYGGTGAAVIGAVALVKAVEAVSDLHYGREQRDERMDRVSISLVGRGLLSIAVLTAVVVGGGSLAWALVGVAAAWMLVLLFHDARGTNWREVLGSACRSRMARLVRISLPLGSSAMLLSLNVNLPRFFLERELGPEAVGIFTALAYFGMAGNLLMTALSQSAAPRLAVEWQAGDARGFRRVVLRMLAVSFALGAAGVLAAMAGGRTLVTWVYRAEYAVHAGTLTILMLAAAVQYLGWVLGTVVTSMRRFAIQFPIHLFVAALVLGIASPFLHRYGINGAAFLMLIAAMVNLISYSLVLWCGLRTHSWKARQF